MEKIITIIIATILGFITSKIANKKNQSTLSTFLTLIFIVGIAIILNLGYFYVASMMKEDRKLKGRWLERYYEDTTVVYGIATFKYSIWSGDLEFSGSGYNRKGENAGHWKSIESQYKEREYNYFFEGESANPNKPRPRNGVGKIWFEDNFKNGSGHFFSVVSDTTLRDFVLFKIEDSLIQESEEHPGNFIKRVYNGEIKLN